MSNQLQITGGAKVRNLEGVLTGTSGVVSSLGINVPDGIPQLDGSGKILVSQLPNSVMEYKGTWNASTNTPTLADGTGNAGDVYLCNVAGTVNFGSGPITFYVGDQVLYSGTVWQRASGATGSVTSVAMTTPTGLTVTGSPITTSGTLAVTLSSGYIIPTTSFLNGLVPYTGATQSVDLGSYDLNARGIKINGTAGTGHADFKHQSATPTGSASSSTLYADTNGDMAWKNDHSYITTLIGSGNTANRNYTLPNASGTIALTSDLSSFVSASPIGVSGNIPYFTGSYTLGNENGFMYDSSTNRFGVNTTVPNATIGANATIDSGYSLLLKNADANYNGIGFGINTTYGNTFETQKLGVANSMNLTLLNQGGYVSIDESGNFGVNILTPKGGVDIYNSTTASLYLHNSTSGVTATDGVRLSLNSTNANLRNYETGTLTMTSEGDFSVITAATENFRVNSADGSIYQSKVPNSMLKSVSGVITAAVAGTDYVAPSALSGYVPTSRTLTINGTAYDLSVNRSWSVGTVTGTGSADSVAYWNSSTGLTYDSVFYYNSTNKRLGVNTTSPNATIGANAGIDSGYSLLLKNAETNYNGLGFGINSTYGNTIETVKVGTASARNLTLFNQTGYATLTEAGNFGFNILTPVASPSGVGSVGIDIFGGASAAGLGFHNTASGTGNTNGAYIYLLNAGGLTIRNLEGAVTSSSLGDFSVITNGTENFRVNSSDGSIYQSNVANAMLKTVSGVLTAAVAGTDYVAPSALSSYVPTSRTITINGTAQDLSTNRSWSVGTVTGGGASGRLAFWDGASSIASDSLLNWDDTNNRLLVGTSTSVKTVTIYSSVADSQLIISGNAPSVNLTEALSGTILYQAKFGLATANNNYSTGSVAGDFVISSQTGSTIFAYNSTEAMRVDTSRNVGIGGVARSGYRLHVYDTAPLLGIESTTTGNVALRFLQAGTVVSGITYFNGDSTLRITNNNGGVRIGTSSVDPALSIASTGVSTFTSTYGNVLFKGTNASTMWTEYYYNTSTLAGYIGSGSGILSGASASDFIIRSEAAIKFANGNSTSLTLASTGAATFSSTSGIGVTVLGTAAAQNLSASTGYARFYQSGGYANINIGGLTSGSYGGWIQSSDGVGTSLPLLINPSGGNVGIGTTSPFSQGTGATSLEVVGSTYGQLYVYGSGGAPARGGFMGRGGGFGDVYLAAISNAPLVFGTNDTERMRITSGGDVLVGQTSASGGSNGIYLRSGVESGFIVSNTNALKLNRLGNTGEIVTFFQASTQVGSISVTGSTTSYNITSDYRLKQDFKDYNALSLVNSIKTYDYEWKSDKTRAYGVIAHELQEVLPYAVQGEKDGEDMQGVDYSKLVPILVKAIQEQQAQIEELKSLINK